MMPGRYFLWKARTHEQVQGICNLGSVSGSAALIGILLATPGSKLAALEHPSDREIHPALTSRADAARDGNRADDRIGDDP